MEDIRCMRHRVNSPFGSSWKKHPINIRFRFSSIYILNYLNLVDWLFMCVPQLVLFWVYSFYFVFHLFRHNGKSKPITTNQEMSQRNTTSTTALIVNDLGFFLLIKAGFFSFFFAYIIYFIKFKRFCFYHSKNSDST